MININNYIARLTDLLKQRFGSRLLYVGLQGSYLRGEATESSDIDIMVVIDGLDMSALAAYRRAIESLEHFDKSCGFICSKADLAMGAEDDEDDDNNQNNGFLQDAGGDPAGSEIHGNM